MADQLITPTELASWLQQDLDLSTANVVINAATAVVQNAAARQRLVLVEDDEIELIGTTDSWLHLPQRPVVEVVEVVLDDETLTIDAADVFLGHAAKIWRDDGWAASARRPSKVAVTYSHGYVAGDPELELARSAAFSLAATPYSNPTGATQVKIDDYAEVYAALSARMEAARGLKAALRAQYGRRSGLVRVG